MPLTSLLHCIAQKNCFYGQYETEERLVLDLAELIQLGSFEVSFLWPVSQDSVLGLALSLLSSDSLIAACSLSIKVDLKPLVLRPLAISAFLSSVTFHFPISILELLYFMHML